MKKKEKKAESLKEYHKEYYKRNREKIIKRATEYNKTHRDRVRETSRKYEMRRVEKLKQLEEENKKLNEEIWKLGLHIEAKDKAYIKLLKDYEELKESSETKEETLIKAIGYIFNKLKD